MSDFNYDKKKEHERAAAAALETGDLPGAYFHVKEAAKHTAILASRCGGLLRAAYEKNANALIDAAEKLKAKAEAKVSKPAAGKDVAAETRDGTTAGEESPSHKWTVAKNTGILLEDVKGLSAAKDAVRDALINPVKHPDVYKTLKVKPGTGLLLYGPPGTGKTMFAKAIANEMDTTFMHVKLNDLKSKYVGETEQNIAAMFKEARSYERCVLFLDECESLLRKRGNQKVCMVEQFLVELDGFKAEGAHQLFVLLATNRPWLIDSAITRSGRICTMVYVDLPDRETRELIIRSALADVPLAGDVDVAQIAEKTEGYSGAELSHKEHGGGVCDEACLYAARRWIERREGHESEKESSEWTATEFVTRADFDKAIASVVPTSRRDADIIRRNQEYSRTGGSVDDASDGDD